MDSIIKSKIADVLRKYFMYDDDGNPNEAYSPDLSAEDALDEIHEIIGSI